MRNPSSIAAKKADVGPDDFIDLLRQSGQLSLLEAEYLANYYHFASILDELMVEFDARGLSRARDVLPLNFGAQLIRKGLRITCRAAGAESHPNCPVWLQGTDYPWKPSCAICKRPSASRAVTCAMLFPSSNKKLDLRLRVPKSPGLVSVDQLRKWTSGSRPLPANRALQVLRSLRQAGHLPDSHFDHDHRMVEATVRFARNLRRIRRMLALNWLKMIEEDRTFVANWNGFDHWYVSNRNESAHEDKSIVDPETYPYAYGHEIFNELCGLPRFEPIKLQSVRVLVEIRVTPFPLPIDPVEFQTYPQGMLAIRLFIRPAAAS